MKKSRSGYTMIELTLVIVIIGIMASVAIPKLSATRDDARITAEMASLRQAIDNAKMEYASDGSIEDKGYMGTLNEHIDNGCFAVGISQDKTYWVVTHKFQSGLSRNCNMSEANQNRANQKAIKMGLIKGVMVWNMTPMNDRRL